jgi:hypothetical protein
MMFLKIEFDFVVIGLQHTVPVAVLDSSVKPES